MLKSGRKVKGLIAIGAIICFMLGFTTANTIQETLWLGHLVHGAYNEPDPAIFPKNHEHAPTVNGKFMIGLREDGVVVWRSLDEIGK